jgi:hypothetical protein
MLEQPAREDSMIRILTVLLVLGSVFTTHPVHGADKEEDQKKKTVVAFYEKAVNQKDFEAASRYMGPRYTQHNPMAADGPEGLKGYL